MVLGFEWLDGLLRYGKSLTMPLTIIITAFVVGVVLNRIIYNRLSRINFNNELSIREVIIKSLKGVCVFWSVMAGIYIAINISPMNKNILDIMGKAMLVLILLSMTLICSRLTVGFVSISIQKAQSVIPSTSLLLNIVELVSYAIGFLIILQSLGISIAPVLTALGVGGLAVALALQDTLSNFIAGIHILLAQRIKPGDYVKLSSGEEGHITDINWRDTTLKGLRNHLVIVPNSKISSAIVTNYALPDKEVAIVFPVGVSYDSDLTKVEQVAREVAAKIMKESAGGVAEYDPIIRFSAFDDSNINFNVIMRGRDFVDTPRIKHEFIKALYARFKEEGIVISYPVRVLYDAAKEMKMEDKHYE